MLGLVLHPVFAHNTPAWVLPYAAVMLVVAACEAASRPRHVYKVGGGIPTPGLPAQPVQPAALPRHDSIIPSNK